MIKHIVYSYPGYIWFTLKHLLYRRTSLTQSSIRQLVFLFSHSHSCTHSFQPYQLHEEKYTLTSKSISSIQHIHYLSTQFHRCLFIDKRYAVCILALIQSLRVLFSGPLIYNRRFFQRLEELLFTFQLESCKIFCFSKILKHEEKSSLPSLQAFVHLLYNL